MVSKEFHRKAIIFFVFQTHYTSDRAFCGLLDTDGRYKGRSHRYQPSQTLQKSA